MCIPSMSALGCARWRTSLVLLILGMEPAVLLTCMCPAPPASGHSIIVRVRMLLSMTIGPCAHIASSGCPTDCLHSGRHAGGIPLEAEPRAHPPEESLGEDEKGERAWDDMDCGEVLPDITAPSVACTCALHIWTGGLISLFGVCREARLARCILVCNTEPCLGSCG